MSSAAEKTERYSATLWLVTPEIRFNYVMYVLGVPFAQNVDFADDESATLVLTMLYEQGEDRVWDEFDIVFTGYVRSRTIAEIWQYWRKFKAVSFREARVTSIVSMTPTNQWKSWWFALPTTLILLSQLGFIVFMIRSCIRN